MRCGYFLFSIVVGISTSVFAQKPAWQPASGRTTLPVWPAAAPGAPANSAPEVDATTAKDNLIAGKPIIRLGNVSVPTLTLYPVSYTHLDVYKRQRLIWSASSD